MKKWFLASVMVSALINGIVSAGAIAQTPAKNAAAKPAATQNAGKNEPTWQQSEAMQVQLGVRSKFGTTPYEAEFIIHDENGGKFKAKKSVKGDAWGYAIYPDDFSTTAQPGSYKWKCMVSGKEVSSGKFKIKSNGGFGNELKIER